jgi:hypothetical protein
MAGGVDDVGSNSPPEPDDSMPDFPPGAMDAIKMMEKMTGNAGLAQAMFAAAGVHGLKNDRR